MKVCSNVPETPLAKPFWICCSMKPFWERQEKIESRRQDVKTLSGTDSRVIGLKLAGHHYFLSCVLVLCKLFSILPAFYLICILLELC